jgi:hypothetical protein
MRRNLREPREVKPLGAGAAKSVAKMILLQTYGFNTTGVNFSGTGDVSF